MELLSDKYITGLYQELERNVISDIARRVKKTGRFTETAELMAKSMKLQGYSPEQIRVDVMKMLRADADYQREVAQNTKEYKAYVQGLINETYREARKSGAEMFDEAANMAFNNDLSMWEEHGEDLSKPSSLSQLAEGAAKQTNDQFRNLTRTTGFRNTKLGTVGVMNAYQKEMDLAVLSVATGAFSYDQAVRDCVTRLAQSGLRSIDYSSGRTYQLDTAARMCIRTGFGQLTGKIMEANLQNMGHDLVITSQHMGSRPEHAVWQNKVFSYSGKNKKYPDFVKETGYGTVTGLMGANCRHDYYAYWEGDYIPPDLEEPEPVTVDGKEYTYYQATQKQRLMERNIRATKREIEAMGAIGEDTTELRSKLRYQTKEYRRFSEAVGIRAKDDRLRVATGTSNLNQTRVAKRFKNDIIKNNSLNSINDPMAEIFGSGETSNPEELKEFRAELELLGVELVERKRETLGYAPGLRRGEQGIVYISQGASYSAWCHEMQHVRDDCQDGWSGMRILEDADERYERERRAYSIEIDLAIKAGREDIAERLRQNLEEERRRIYGIQ